jgi:molybdopterin-guanine dinucleotide biosynthesis protein A
MPRDPDIDVIGDMPILASMITSLPVGIIVERRTVRHRWAKESWLPVALVPGAPTGEPWRRVAEGPGWTRYLAAVLPLELHRRESEHYRLSLSAARPSAYVVMRPQDVPKRPLQPVHITVSPFESIAHTEFGEDRVEPVPLSPELIAWIAAFIEANPVEEIFYKRKRKGRDKAEGETSDFVRADQEAGHG